MKVIILAFTLVLSSSAFSNEFEAIKNSKKNPEIVISESIESNRLDLLNTYVEYNSEQLSKKMAKNALELISLKLATRADILNVELVQRLRLIAF